MESKKKISKEGFLLFHFNLAFSSIKDKEHIEVIKKCYYPIIQIASKSKIPITIELSAWTLERIAELDKKFIFYLKKLIKGKKIELVGSGYCQIIGPLVPYKVNLWNQQIAMKIYKKILNVVPKFALINEMAMSDGLIQIYNKMKYKGIFLELENTELALQKKINYQDYNNYVAVNQLGEKIPIYWTESMIFQKLQRYIHGEINENEYINFINKNLKKKSPIPIYSNDAEVFNFRPGRFKNEKKIYTNEVEKLENIIFRLKKKINLKLPHQIKKKNKKKILNVNSSSFPISVKKQMKYNISRWSVSGIDSFKLNTLTFKYFFQNKNTKKELVKKKILRFWSSDLRTHTRTQRWKKNISKLIDEIKNKKKNKRPSKKILAHKYISYDKEKFVMHIKTELLNLDLNLKKGMAIDNLSFKRNNFQKSIGTLKQGFFPSIKYGVDFFSGNFVSEVLEEKEKFTDLSEINPEIFIDDKNLIIASKINLKFGKLIKTYKISLSSEEIKLNMKFKQYKNEHSVIRPFHFTLCNFNKNLYYKTKNGGNYFEKYYLKKSFDQSENVSNFISNTSGIGATDGNLIFGDKNKKILFSWEQDNSALLPMIKFQKISKKFLTRVIFSCSEINDTSKKRKNNFDATIKIKSIN